MINKTSGEINIGEVKIGSKFTKSDFVDFSLYAQVIREDNNIYSRFVLKPQKLDNELFTVTFYFDPNGRLEFISLSVLIHQEMPSWENWSKEEELRIKKYHDKWLENHLGVPPYKYQWGGISSLFDPRSGTSSITIRYLLSAEE